MIVERSRADWFRARHLRNCEFECSGDPGAVPERVEDADMADQPSDKTTLLSQLFGQMDRHMDTVLRSSFLQWNRSVWQPPVNLYETADRFLLCMDVANVDYEKIDIQLLGGALTIRGKRRDVTPTEQVRVHVMEIDQGEFRREIDVPQTVDRDRIQASYRDGFLWIELPKTPTE